MHNLKLTFLGHDLALSVLDFRVEEAMNRPFELFLTIGSKESLDLSALIGQFARFDTSLRPSKVEDAQQLESDMPGSTIAADWTGVVADIEEFSAAEPGMLSFSYRVHVVHPMWILGQNKNYRVFQQLSELDMVRALLDEWGIAENLRLDPGQYKRRDYRIQYGESDLNFIHRSLEDLGISYYAEKTSEGEAITFSAEPERNEVRPVGLRFVDEPATVTHHVWATGVTVRRSVRAGRYTLQDVDYRMPPERQPRIFRDFGKTGSRSPLTHQTSEVEKSLETYEYNPGIFCVENDGDSGDSPANDRLLRTRTDDRYGQWLTEVRLRAVQASRYRVHFQTNAFDLHPGAVTRIEDHPRPELAEPLLITKICFSGTLNGEWAMSCVAHPTSLPFVPEMVTPRPCASGVESATVVGTPGKQIDSQEFGSVLVQFHWDRESTRDEHASCWVPVSYGLAGPGRGMFSLPRIGEEVLVDFLAGDLDKPMITGRVYTGVNKPWTSDVSKMGDFSIKNDSLDDASQNTFIHMTADKKPLMHLCSTHDKQLTVGNDERCAVTKNRNRTVGASETVNVGATQSVTVNHHQHIRVQKTYNRVVNATATTTVKSDISLTSLEGGIATVGKTYVADDAPIVTQTASDMQIISCGESTIAMFPGLIVIDAPKTLINPGAGWTQFLIGSGGTFPEAPEPPTKPPALIDENGNVASPASRQRVGKDSPENAKKRDEYWKAKEKYDREKYMHNRLIERLDKGEMVDGTPYRKRQINP